VIEKVNVKAGDAVKSGDVLATLVQTSVPASVLSAEADLINSQKTVEDLTPTALAISQAEQKVALAVDDVHNKQRIADGLGTPASQADIDQADATVLLAKIKLDKAWDKYKPYQNKSDTSQIKAYFYNQWAQAQQQHDDAVRRLNNLKGVTVNKTDLELAKANLELSKVTLADALKKLEELKAGADAQDVAAAQARITAAKATLSALSLTAPFDGEILVADLLPGDVVSTGQTAFTLADRNQLHVDTLIDETDIASVKIGDKVTLTMDSVPGAKLTGKVDFINPMGQTISGNVKYPVRIALDPIDQPILLEATADVRIETGAPRTLLTVPVRAIQADSTGEFVNTVQADGTLKRVDVVSGQLQGDRVIILSGDLKDGDRVELATTSNEMLDRMNNMGQ
jgi:RND family efflux transporter MFP subunit